MGKLTGSQIRKIRMLLTVEGKEPQWVTKPDMESTLKSLDGDLKIPDDEIEAMMSCATKDPTGKCKVRLKWFIEENSDCKSATPTECPEMKTDAMLASDVKGAGSTATQTFNSLPRLSVAEFVKKSGNRSREIQWSEQSIYREFVDKDGNKCSGMVKPKTRRKHGITRMVVIGEYIEEAMFKSSAKHGMDRTIMDNGEYVIRHWKDGRLHGLETYYKSDGEIIAQTEFKQGRRATLQDKIDTANEGKRITAAKPLPGVSQRRLTN